MKNIRVVKVKKLNLHSMNDYLKALTMITNINSLSEYLKNNIIPVIADWPGQLFIRKIITQSRLNPHLIPNNVTNFIPILGPLHVSLNFRETVFSVHYTFFEQFFYFVFGDKKKLAKNPRPWRINLILELIHEGWKAIAHIILAKFDPIYKDIEYRMLLDI